MGDLLQDLQQAASLQGQVSFAVAPGLVSSGRVKLVHSLAIMELTHTEFISVVVYGGRFIPLRLVGDGQEMSEVIISLRSS